MSLSCSCKLKSGPKKGFRCDAPAKIKTRQGNFCGRHAKCNDVIQQPARGQQPSRVVERYNILQNGGTPYVVDVYRNQKKVIVYEGSSFVSEFKYQKIFLKQELNFVETRDGSTILLKTGKNKYILIWSYIMEFKTNDDEIVVFASPISGTVPYPYAIGNKYSYDFVNDKFLDNKFVSPDVINLKFDLYGSYEFENSTPLQGKILHQVKGY